MEYHKIETLFNRLEDFSVGEELREPLYGSFKTWHVTEKIDGTNIRIMLSADGEVTFGGRTDNAQLHAGLLEALMKMFTAEKMKAALWLPDETGNPLPVKVVLYGEGYGAGIQKGGGDYNKEKTFRLFDVLVSDKYWLDWSNVEDVAKKLDIKTAPYLGEWTFEEIVMRVKVGINSEVAREENPEGFAQNPVMAEGIIGRTLSPLFDRRGKRIILKLKTSDFQPGKKR
jgi:hypothetical protein